MSPTPMERSEMHLSLQLTSTEDLTPHLRMINDAVRRALIQTLPPGTGVGSVTGNWIPIIESRRES